MDCTKLQKTSKNITRNNQKHQKHQKLNPILLTHMLYHPIRSRSAADPQPIRRRSVADPPPISSRSAADPQQIRSRSAVDPQPIRSRFNPSALIQPRGRTQLQKTSKKHHPKTPNTSKNIKKINPMHLTQVL
jgi:hypothetical protein